MLFDRLKLSTKGVKKTKTGLSTDADVLVKLARKLRVFTYDPSRSFRGWLKTLAHHAWQDFVASPRRVQAAAGDVRVWELMQSLEAREDLVQKLQEAFDHDLLAG